GIVLAGPLFSQGRDVRFAPDAVQVLGLVADAEPQARQVAGERHQLAADSEVSSRQPREDASGRLRPGGLVPVDAGDDHQGGAGLLSHEPADLAPFDLDAARLDPIGGAGSADTHAVRTRAELEAALEATRGVPEASCE